MKAAKAGKIGGVAAVGVAVVGATAMVAFAGTEDLRTVRVSVSSTGAQLNRSSSVEPLAVSDGGRFVVFGTTATGGLAPGSHPMLPRIYVRDTVSGTTAPVSVDAKGNLIDEGETLFPSISADGRYVAFSSNSPELKLEPETRASEIFVRDMVAGVTTRASAPNGEVQPPKPTIPFKSHLSTSPSISANGRHVVFVSSADGLVPGDDNHGEDIFVRDLVANTTTRVAGGEKNPKLDQHASCSLRCEPRLSADGRYLTFSSESPNLVPGDTNDTRDIFVRDLVAGTTTRASVATDGAQPVAVNGVEATSSAPAITADGRYVFFHSSATNLVPGADKAGLFRRDMVTGTTTLLKAPANLKFWGEPSADGRYLSWVSDGPERSISAFVLDTVTGLSSPANISSNGETGDDRVFGEPVLSPDGSAVAFTSKATNLVEGDTNKEGEVFLRTLRHVEPGEPTEAPANLAAPTGTFALSASTTAPGQAVTLSQVTLAGNGTASEQVGRVVLWGDGSAPQTLAAGATTATHAYVETGVYPLQVALVDRAGNSTGARIQGPSAVLVAVTYPKPTTPTTPSKPATPAKDTFAPVITVTVPKKPTVVASWKQLAGTATDRGLGVRSVQVVAIQKRGAVWFAFTGKSWVRASSQAVAQSKAARLVVVPNAKGGWTRALTGVTKGTLKVTYSGVDKAGNTATAKVVTQVVTK